MTYKFPGHFNNPILRGIADSAPFPFSTWSEAYDYHCGKGVGDDESVNNHYQDFRDNKWYLYRYTMADLKAKASDEWFDLRPSRQMSSVIYGSIRRYTETEPLLHADVREWADRFYRNTCTIKDKKL